MQQLTVDIVQIQEDLRYFHSNSSDLWKTCPHRTVELLQQQLSFFRSRYPESASLRVLTIHLVSSMPLETTEIAVLSLPALLTLWYLTAIPMITSRFLTVWLMIMKVCLTV